MIRHSDAIGQRKGTVPGVITASGLICILSGIIGLLGWITGNTLLASFNPTYVPMAPTTGILAILGGVLLLGDSRLSTRLLGSIAGFMVALSAIILALRLSATYLELELLGLVEAQTLEGIPLGYMSVITACCFLLGGISFATNLVTGMGWRFLKTLAYGPALLLSGITFIFLLGYLYGEPIMYSSNAIPPALTTVLMFGALSLGLLLSIRRRQDEITPGHQHSYNYPLITVFVFLLLGIIAVGGMYFSNYEKQYRKEIGKSLQSISNLKVSHISYWRTERISDGIILYHNRELATQVADYIKASPQARTKHPLQSWLSTYNAYGEIKAALVDLEGNTILSQYPDNAGVSKEVAVDVRRIAAADSVFLHDFYRDEHDGRVYLAIVVPVKEIGPSDKPIAVLVLRVDPHYFLFPFVQQWPTESESGETLIVRRDDNDILFLNSLRFRKNTELRFRIPTSRIHLPAALAVTGTTGIVEGMDYRNIEVFAFVEKIPGSPWYLVAKIDKYEVFAELRERLILLSGLVVFLAISAGGWLTLAVRRQRLQFYKERFEATEALKDSEYRLRQAESVGHLGHWRYDMATKELSWSDEMYKIHGQTSNSFRPSLDRMLLLIHPDDREIYRVAIARIPESGSETFEYRIITNDGVTRHVMVRGLVGLAEDGNPSFIYGITLDTTEIKMKERELEATNSELTRFTYTVSHDLKSPLVTVRTFLGYLEQDTEIGDKEAIQKDMGFIATAINKMSQLLDELLEMSRVGRVVNPPERVACRELVEEALAIVAGRIQENNINITVHNVDVELNVDRTRMVEVWQNLIDNAVKYMGETPNPTIEIGSIQENGNCTFYIRDNGMGIDPRHKDKVFGLFEKLHQHTEGTGIGLALVKRIIGLFEGKIWLESEGIGHGTTFYFTIPSALTNQGATSA